ncbi:tyrosine-type recombinase/integrase [Hoeflea prorocentri]|uniref:Tyrosine-type recombinase/integrase n=1 Tax=Hoeflea prorocentri TaxID=1922333 RepID=A0A9X3UFD4_9HYPH|nr:tyrosine-type recombinase/integrase [Hoeflea prorocentri]MCY6380252.1 tyrosine-type recombinase/integrase [Hoeflea prorocentri]MDA5398052.1 tyrosine-type recombinase/integrase [Hoeflea prorocentri]
MSLKQDLDALVDATRIFRSADRALTTSALITLLFVTGMRIGETIRLDIEDFDATRGTLLVRNTKFDKTPEIPLHPSLVTAPSSYLKRDDQPRRRPGIM